MITIPHLETDITTACNLSCVCCNHLVVPYRQLGKVWKSSPQQVKKDLSHLSTILHANTWGALGGEPTLHPQLLEILQIVRDSHIANKMEVWTNGMFLRKMIDRFWSGRLFDILVVSRYEDKLSDEDVEWIRQQCAEYKIELVIKDERNWHNFRTNLEPIPTDYETTKSKFLGCFFRSFSRVVNNGYFYTCCCIPHMPQLLQGREEGADGIKVEGLTENELREYLERTEPLGACTICAGRDTAKPVIWQEDRKLDSWLEKSKGVSSLL